MQNILDYDRMLFSSMIRYIISLLFEYAVLGLILSYAYTRQITEMQDYEGRKNYYEVLRYSILIMVWVYVGIEMVLSMFSLPIELPFVVALLLEICGYVLRAFILSWLTKRIVLRSAIYEVEPYHGKQLIDQFRRVSIIYVIIVFAVGLLLQLPDLLVSFNTFISGK